MYRQLNTVFLAVLAFVSVVPCGSARAASEYVVVAVDPPTDTPPLGKLFRVGDLVHIENGSIVTLMGDDGSVTALPGPADVLVTDDGAGAGSAANGATSTSSSLAAISDLLGNASDQLQTIGGSRSVSDKMIDTLQPWAVPVEAGVTGCIHNRRLSIWRSAADHKSDVTVAYGEASQSSRLIWEKGSPVLAISEEVPADLESVSLVIDDKSVQIPIMQLPRSVTPSDNLGLYAWMLASGCHLQASALVRHLTSR